MRPSSRTMSPPPFMFKGSLCLFPFVLCKHIIDDGDAVCILTIIYVNGKTCVDIDNDEYPVLFDTDRVGMIFCSYFRGSITNY